MGYPETFEGYQINSQKDWQTFKKQEFKPKPFGDFDIDIAIDACGVCGSDVHKISGGWGECHLPLAVGHEVVGKAVKIGPKVSTVKVGDRVGVGAQIGACLECRICKSDNENYCPHQIDTYDAPYPDGTITQGGYSSHIRAHEYFTFAIPDNISTELAAPMLCAGITSYSPLVRAGIGPGKKVAVVGVGGLGHFGILFAVALGAEVYAVSHSPRKEADAIKMGAKGFIATKEKGWEKPWNMYFDYILNTADATDRFDMTAYMSILGVNGMFHNVGLPDKPLPELKAQSFTANGCAIGASHIGSRPEMISMFKLASEKNIKSWVETIKISEEGCKEAVTRVYNNDNVRYRFTLVGYDEAFGKRS